MFLKGVFEVIKYSDNEIIFDIFLRDKKDGSYRMIFNLKKLNMYVVKVYFKMDMLYIIIKLIRKDCFMVFIDLKDVYYLVLVNKNYRKYLRFIWKY